MSDTSALPPADGAVVTDPAAKPAKKAAAKKAAAAEPRTRPTESLKYAYTVDDHGNVTSLAPCGSTDALFEYVKANPGKAFRFIDGPKGADVIALINAAS